MRTLFLAAALALAATLGAAAPAEAQCATGCSSSSACNGTGRGGCVAVCTGDGKCECNDSDCKPQITQVVPATPSAATTLASWTAFVSTVTTHLVTDCRGAVLDVVLRLRDGSAPVLSPTEIVFETEPATRPTAAGS
jgi:hypothetical protein